MLNLIKQCSNPNCTEINPQPLSQFNKNRSKKDGLYIYCKVCHRDINKSWGRQNSKKKQAFYKHWYQGNPQRNRDKEKASYKADSSRKKANNKKWAKMNPGKMSAKIAKRKAQKLKATPKWVTKEQKWEIRQFYIKASRLTRETRIPHHVDHIIPLQGNGIVGLHLPWNLQILTEHENCLKSNSFDGTFKNESWRK